MLEYIASPRFAFNDELTRSGVTHKLNFKNFTVNFRWKCSSSDSITLLFRKVCQWHYNKNLLVKKLRESLQTKNKKKLTANLTDTNMANC